MNVICPICNQTLNAADLPPETKVNCSRCLNDFLIPEYNEVLPVAHYQNPENASSHTDEPSTFFGKITSFKGRIGKRQYFYGFLFKIGLMLCVGLISMVSFYIEHKLDDITMILIFPLSLFVIWVNLSLQARRLHDMGRSGFWLLLYLVPSLNFIFALVIYILCLASEGNKKANKYGSAPYRIF